MVHCIFQIILGYLLWKYFPSWLRLRDSKTIDHYIIVGLSLVGILMIILGVFHLVRLFLHGNDYPYFAYRSKDNYILLW